jgi:hypothetical protein
VISSRFSVRTQVFETLGGLAESYKYGY